MNEGRRKKRDERLRRKAQKDYMVGVYLGVGMLVLGGPLLVILSATMDWDKNELAWQWGLLILGCGIFLMGAGAFIIWGWAVDTSFGMYEPPDDRY